MVKISKKPSKMPSLSKKSIQKPIKKAKSKIKTTKLKNKIKSSPQTSPKKPKKIIQEPPKLDDEEIESLRADSGSEDGELEPLRAESGSDDEEDVEIQESKFKLSMANLAKTDSEFYNFLKENDRKLLNLNFDASDSDPEEPVEELHKPSAGELEVASDESDFEDDGSEAKRDDRVVTLKMLRTWRKEIGEDRSNGTITALIRAFHAAVSRVSEDSGDVGAGDYKVEGSAVFNGIIQICVLELGPAIRRYLRIAPGSRQPPHKCKRFVKIKALLRGYFVDLLKILKGVTSSNILTVLLKHLHYMAPMIVSYGNVTKPILRKLTDLWGTSDENVRVVAFLCVLRIANNRPEAHLDTALKTMHLTYVRNSKFVSLNSLPGVNFMRRSLIEMYMLDPNVSYQHVFLNIRQLAIHLRNAITVRKKENFQTVYNWQFVNSLRLWGGLLATGFEKPQLKSLVYPFVQVCLGTIKLVPTTQYFPLRFHLVQVLMDLSAKTRVFIPVLPFLCEVLTNYDFNKKHQKVSMKPLHFTCILRLSKSQLTENGFKDTLIDTVYSQLLEYLSTYSNTLGFPDLTIFPILQIRQFLKSCNVSSYCRKMKQLLEKIEENSKFIEKQRKNIQFNLNDFKQIDAWETRIRNEGTPLSKYYENWNKLRTIKKSKEATNNEAMGEYNLPTIKRIEKVRNPNEKVELFPSDSESENEEVKIRNKRGKRGGKNVKKFKKGGDEDVEEDDDFEEDIVEDIKASDW